MTIDFSEYEAGARYAGDYAADLAVLQKRLAKVQVAHIVHLRRALILFEGWDASGKGGTIQRLTAEWDPRHFQVWPIAAPRDEERRRHFLWRFWQRLPGDGEIGVFDRSWYGRVLVERVEGFATPEQWQRAFCEINEFEAQQTEDGTDVLKLFLHVTQEEQDERIKARLHHPWKRWKTGREDFRNLGKRAAYLDALHEMFARTDTRWAPWKVIDGNDKRAARLAALTWIAERLEKHVPMEPPEADPDMITLARAHFGDDFEL
jgi:polyphosphate kinase 2 (PPK2 family)